MRQVLFLLFTLSLAACDPGQSPPIGRPEDGSARFEFLSSWEPSTTERRYVTLVDYAFVVRNSGGRAGAPACEVLLRGKPLEGWSEASEIGVSSRGTVEGQALLPPDADPNKLLTNLEPRCRQARGKEPWVGVPHRFFGMEGDAAYFELKQLGFQVRFGFAVSRLERQNIRGRRSHPEVVFTALERELGTDIITIAEVNCVGREEDLC